MVINSMSTVSVSEAGAVYRTKAELYYFLGGDCNYSMNNKSERLRSPTFRREIVRLFVRQRLSSRQKSYDLLLLKPNQKRKEKGIYKSRTDLIKY